MTTHSLKIAGALLVLPLAVTIARGQSEADQIVAAIKADLKDPAKPFTMTVRLQVKAGMQAKLEGAFTNAVKESRKEKGCITYDLARDAKDPTRYLVYERWKSLSDLEAHLKSKPITALLSDIKELLASPPEATVLLPAAE